MTNKQLIDGVDVIGCEWYSKHREGYCGWHTPCAGDSCSYKLKWALQQLKVKEQECEILKDENFHLRNEGKKSCAYCADLIAKEQECDELKEEQTEIKKYLGISSKSILKRLEELTEFRDSDRDEIFQLKEQLNQIKEHYEQQLKAVIDKHNNLLKENKTEYTELMRLRQTLAEIKEIAENLTDNYGHKVSNAQIILQKISECEVK